MARPPSSTSYPGIPDTTYPVSITVPAGEWRFAASYSRHTHGYTAELNLDTYSANPALRTYTQNLSTLEERLGFAIPSAARRALDQSPRIPHFGSPRQIIGLHEVPPNPTLRPTRYSLIRTKNQPNSTYSAAMERDHPLYSWQEREIRIDILAARHALPSQGRDSVYYRIWHHDTVVFAGTDVHLPATINPRSLEAVRAVAGGLDGIWGGEHLTDRQHEFLLKYGRHVLDAVTAGTRALSDPHSAPARLDLDQTATVPAEGDADPTLGL